jgi:formylglycine-generating enzyme required for sulfatase activity
VSIDSGFWIFDTPCTQALWEAVAGENPSGFKGPDRPVETVSWEECQEFLAALNSRLVGLSALARTWEGEPPGAPRRNPARTEPRPPEITQGRLELSLPSEAQWEYACRAGMETARYSENLNAIAWYYGNRGSETHPVAGKEANSWGLYDMLGNVYEWCADVWVNDYTEKARASVTESASAHRVIRGGSWHNVARGVRAAYRDRVEPSARGSALGFRCAEFRAGSGAE